MTKQRIYLDAAVGCARRMTFFLDACAKENHGSLETHPSVEAALFDIASGTIGFGDICDDNVFIHDVLASRGLISQDSSENVSSWEMTNIWNTVTDNLAWAAEQILMDRVRQNPVLRKHWPYFCGSCGIPMRSSDAVLDPAMPHSGMGLNDGRFCRGCHEVHLKK